MNKPMKKLMDKTINKSLNKIINTMMDKLMISKKKKIHQIFIWKYYKISRNNQMKIWIWNKLMRVIKCKF
jgi:hypothetical protein